MKNDEVIFSVKAQDELTAVYGKLRIMHNLVIKTLREDNARLANEITEHENKVDEIIKRIADSQAKRIQTGKCTVTASKYFSEILYNLERIGDHYDNIAYAVIDRLRHKERNPQTK
jgi:phosphate:Na+ symporter